MKGASKLKGLVDRILQKFKFKKFKLERKGKHIRLYGEVNPWVLLIDGELRDIKEQNLEKELKQLELDGKKPIKLSDAEYSKLSKLEDTELKAIAESADGAKSKIQLESLNTIEKNSKAPIKYGEHIDQNGNKKILKPNVKYTSPEGYSYETDELGRIFNVEADLQLGNGTRNQYAQSNVGGNERIRGQYPERDDGGHLIGSQFKGSGGIDNLVAMNSQINEAGGRWHKMEQEWAAALNGGGNVKVKIKPQYSDNSVRPISFNIEYSINGGRTQRPNIKNQVGG
ncbi:DNA/RNA non-specific endonuclease [Paenibacillus monticola]|nr:DNA/RNA non-specific endonuclease [Paenibacillus monticola]